MKWVTTSWTHSIIGVLKQIAIVMLKCINYDEYLVYLFIVTQYLEMEKTSQKRCKSKMGSAEFWLGIEADSTRKSKRKKTCI